MKLYSFNEYLKNRFSEEQVSEIKEAARIEAESLITIQKQVSDAVSAYMTKEKIGFNEMVRRLGTSPTQLKKIQKGEANLTIAYLSHIFALMKTNIRLNCA